MKRVRITNDNLNCYGFRVLTSGINTEQYQRNPVLLYMHQRGTVIGYIKDLKTENGEVTGEPVFDEVTELSQRCKKQYEFGSLRMVSAGLEILDTSSDKAVLVEGQTRPTITRSKLNEVSLVDIGANDDAIVLTKNGKEITLSNDGSCDLPLLPENIHQNQIEMDQKILAVQLGLPETATEEEITAKLEALKEAEQANVTLKQENETLQSTRIEVSVDRAISEKRISQDKRDQFIALGRKIGVEDLDKTFSAMAPAVKLSSIVGHQGSAAQTVEKQYAKLSDVPEAELKVLRKNDLELYKKLYEAEYNMPCELEEESEN